MIKRTVRSNIRAMQISGLLKIQKVNSCMVKNVGTSVVTINDIWTLAVGDPPISLPGYTYPDGCTQRSEEFRILFSVGAGLVNNLAIWEDIEVQEKC